MLTDSLCVLFVVCVTVAQHVTEEKTLDEGRDLRDYNNQDWKAMDSFTSIPMGTGWVPHQSSESEEHPPRRRRVRKRKRRPPVIDLVEEETTVSRKRARPQRLDQMREPWEDISQEMTQRSYNRRRLTPVYEESVEKIRDPFTALQEAEEKQRKRVEDSTIVPNLKTLLKQSGGLSLSEVLQQKNLSLAELLTGNQEAISALASEATTETTSTEWSKYRRFPSSTTVKNDDVEGLSSHEIMEAQRKRLVLLQGAKNTKIFSDVTRYDVVTEETTEKRIFVPANSKLYTSVDYRPSIIFKDITTTPLSTMKEVPVSFKPRELPMTSAKLKKVVSKSNLEIPIPPAAVRIDINEILGLTVPSEKNNYSIETSDGPFKMSIDLGEIMQEEELKTVAPTQVVEELKATTAASVGEKLKHVTAKEEIMEILKNPYDREQLSKILEKRNMTVDELVALRERGSSQLHLADIFHNKTREPEPEGEPFIGHVNAVDIHFFNRKSKNIPMSTIPSPTTRSLMGEKEMMTTRPPYTITSFPTYKIETNKNPRPPLVPVWKQLYPSFFPDIYDNRLHEDPRKATMTTTTERIIYDLDSLEDFEKTLTQAANRNQGLSPRVFEDNTEFIGLPTGVKSAIFASLAIIGLSLLVFLSILVVFKWTQKQKRRLNYTGSFSGSKIKSPILEPNQRRTFKTFMVETLGKKKNYYKAHLQNMSDNFWDTANEKKSYMM